MSSVYLILQLLRGMGAKAKKSLKKKLVNTQLALARRSAKDASSDYLPLEGGPSRNLPEPEEPIRNTASVLYIGRIPHGFYEDEMEGFFKQFGKIKRLRIARNKKTGKSKHYGFLEFENPEVAKVVADEMHNYLIFEHNLQIHLIPPEKVHPKLWKGVTQRFLPPDWGAIERKRHNKERTIEEHRRLLRGIKKREEKRRKRIEAAGIDYECPDFVGQTQPIPKKIKFADSEE